MVQYDKNCPFCNGQVPVTETIPVNAIKIDSVNSETVILNISKSVYDKCQNLFKELEQDKPYLCADCGHHQDYMNDPCEKCGSIKIVTKAFAIAHFGPNYMNCFKEKE